MIWPIIVLTNWFQYLKIKIKMSKWKKSHFNFLFTLSDLSWKNSGKMKNCLELYSSRGKLDLQKISFFFFNLLNLIFFFFLIKNL
jgi:hypothetical protein